METSNKNIMSNKHTLYIEHRGGDFILKSSYLTGSEDDPVIVLLAVFLVFLQFLPPQTNCHWAQVFIHPQIVPVLYGED